MQRPEAMPWPTPEPMAARPIAKPAPTADNAGIQTFEPSACAAAGVTSAAALTAAAGKACATGGCAKCLGVGAGTKLRATDAISAPPISMTTAVIIMERGAAISLQLQQLMSNGIR